MSTSIEIPAPPTLDELKAKLDGLLTWANQRELPIEEVAIFSYALGIAIAVRTARDEVEGSGDVPPEAG